MNELISRGTMKSIPHLLIIDCLDFATSRHVEEGRKRQYTQETEDTELTNEFRKPRDLFLTVIAEFYSTCQPRLKSNELRRMLVDATSRPPTELLDHKSHNV